MRRFHDVILLFFVSLILNAKVSSQETVAISGRVLNSNSSDFVPGAVLIIHNNVVSLTDEKGEFSFKIPQGKYELSVQSLGFKKYSDTIDVTNMISFNIDIQLTQASKNLEMYVITGSRYEKRIAEEVVSVELVTSDFISNNQAITAADVLNRVPGVTISDGQASIRGGSGFSYGVGSRVAVLIDGLPILAADQMNADWHFVPLENTRHIEVIKGSGSVLYGSGSMNGIINVITDWPTDSIQTRISPYSLIYSNPNFPEQQWYGDDATPFGHGLFVSHKQKISANTDFVLGGNYHVERSYLEKGGQKRIRSHVKIRHRDKVIKGLIYGVNGSFMMEQSGRFLLWQNSSTNAYRARSWSDDQYYFFNIDPNLSYADNKGNSHHLNSRFYRKFRYGSGEDINVEANIGLVDYQYRKSFLKDRFTLTAGFTGSLGWIQSNLFLDSLQLDSAGKPSRFFEIYSAALFSQLEFKYNRFNVLAGIRYEVNGAYKLLEGSIPVLRFGANYQLLSHTFLRTSFGQAYRIPSLTERFLSASVDALLFYPNLDLKPEKGWSAELGFKQELFLGEHFKGYADFAFFWMEYEEMIQFKLGSFPNIGFKSFNVGNSRIAGWEVSFSGQGKWGEFELFPSLGYTYAYPGDLVNSPQQLDVGVFLSNMWNTFSQNLSYPNADSLLLPLRNRHMFRFDTQMKWKKIGLGINIVYNSFFEKIDDDLIFLEIAIPGFISTYVNNRRERNGDWLFDLRASYEIPKWKSKVSFVVKNITNLEYAARPGLMNPLRSFNLRWDFQF